MLTKFNQSINLCFVFVFKLVNIHIIIIIIWGSEKSSLRLSSGFLWFLTFSSEKNSSLLLSSSPFHSKFVVWAIYDLFSFFLKWNFIILFIWTLLCCFVLLTSFHVLVPLLFLFHFFYLLIAVLPFCIMLCKFCWVQALFLIIPILFFMIVCLFLCGIGISIRVVVLLFFYLPTFVCWISAIDIIWLPYILLAHSLQFLAVYCHLF